MEIPASTLKTRFRKVGRPSNSRSNSMRSGRSIPRENMPQENGNTSSRGVISTIDEDTNELTSLLARPFHTSDGGPLWEDRRPYVKWPATFFHKTYQTLANNPVNILLVFVPLGIVSGAVKWSPTVRHFSEWFSLELQEGHALLFSFSGLSPLLTGRVLWEHTPF